MNSLTSIAPEWIWPLVTVACLVAAFLWSKWERRRAGDDHTPDKFIPIRDAIEHFVLTVDHSYIDGEMFAFESLHRAMCDGKLRVIGSKGEGRPLKRIKPIECRNLTPTRVFVPASNPSTPQGVRYSLFAKTNEVVPLVEYRPGEIIEFSGLRVRSVDLYSLWPKRRGLAFGEVLATAKKLESSGPKGA